MIAEKLPCVSAFGDRPIGAVWVSRPASISGLAEKQHVGFPKLERQRVRTEIDTTIQGAPGSVEDQPVRHISLETLHGPKREAGLEAAVLGLERINAHDLDLGHRSAVIKSLGIALLNRTSGHDRRAQRESRETCGKDDSTSKLDFH